MLPFLAAIWINHLMWGYYVTRPALDRRIALARQIESVTCVETRSDLSGHREFFGVPVGDVDGYSRSILGMATITCWRGEFSVP